MRKPEGVCFDPETIELLKNVLEEAWKCLSPERQRMCLKSDLARRILLAAGRGERDPVRLRMIALLQPMEMQAKRAS